MKLKKYRIVANPFGYVFFDGDALGKERYGYKNISNFFFCWTSIVIVLDVLTQPYLG